MSVDGFSYYDRDDDSRLVSSSRRRTHPVRRNPYSKRVRRGDAIIEEPDSDDDDIKAIEDFDRDQKYGDTRVAPWRPVHNYEVDQHPELYPTVPFVPNEEIANRWIRETQLPIDFPMHFPVVHLPPSRDNTQIVRRRRPNPPESEIHRQIRHHYHRNPGFLRRIYNRFRRGRRLSAPGRLPGPRDHIYRRYFNISTPKDVYATRHRYAHKRIKYPKYFYPKNYRDPNYPHSKYFY